MDRDTALAHARFGRSTAERDDVLSDVFVETDLWARLFAGETDVVLGPKGAGKSALYARILQASATLHRKHKVVVVGAENPADDPIFTRLDQTASLAVREYVGLWKLYFLTIAVSKLRDLRVHDRTFVTLAERLQQEGLLPEVGQSTLVDLFNRALRYADVQFRLHSEVSAAALPVGAAVRATGTITLHEPTHGQARSDTITVNRLLQQLGTVLTRKKMTVWILVDRLDTAFAAVGEEVELIALRALMQAYIDLVAPQYRLSMKLFVRADVWPRIGSVQADRMPGANVIEPSRLEWSDERLLDLFCRRIAHNPDLCRLFGVTRRNAFGNPDAQRELANRLLPTDPAWSFPALLDRLRDGAGHVAPRELIRLLSEARSIQVSRLEMHNAQFAGEELFEPATLDSALRRVAEDRLFQVMCTEYPRLHQPISRLTGTAAEHPIAELARLWTMELDAARPVARQLTWLGFFTAIDGEAVFRVAPLYRPALAIR